MSDSGRCVAINVENMGGELVGAHALGVTVLQLDDTYDFVATGQLTIDGTVHAYTAVDEEAETITLATPTAVAYEDGERVDAYPLAPIKVASIIFGEDEADIPAMVPHNLSPLLAEGVYPDGIPVEVSRASVGRFSFVVNDAPGREPKLDGAAIDPDTTIPPPALTDGIAPATAPVATAAAFAVGTVRAAWPAVANADPVWYTVYASLTTGFTADGSTLVGTKISATHFDISTLSGVQIPLDGTPIFIKVMASDADGDGPISTQSSAAARTGDDYISAFFAYIGTLEANQVNAGAFTADLGLLGKLSVGGYIDIDGAASSITIYADLAHTVPLVQLRPDGSVFRGKVVADDVSVLNGLVLNGLLSQITTGAGVTIMGSIADPNSPPTLTATPQTSMFPAVLSGFTSRGICWDGTDSVFLRLLVPNSGSRAGTCKVQRITTAGVVSSTITLGNIVGIGEDDLNGIARIGSSYYSAAYDSGHAFGKVWLAAKWSTTGVFQQYGTNGLISDVVGRPAVGSTGSDLLIASIIDYGADFDPFVAVATYEASDVSNQSGWFSDDTTWAGPTDLAYVGVGNFDFGAWRWVIVAGSKAYAWTVSGSALTRSATNDFTLPASTVAGGFAWDGTNFFSKSSTTILNKYSSYYPTAGQRTYVTYNDTDGGAGKTLDSPPANVAVPARYYLQAVLAPAPGGAATPNVFMGLGTSLPADSSLDLRAETVTSRTILINPSVAGSATHPPVANTFGAGGSGWLKSQTGSFAVYGDGTGAWPLKMQSGTVTITPSAANTPTGATVTFPVAFASVPYVVISAATSVAGTTVTGWGAYNETTTDFVATVTRTNTTATTLRWIAMIP